MRAVPAFALVLVTLALAGCAAFPRGAGLVREVLAAPGTSGPEDPPSAAGFAFEPVTGARLAVLDGWPLPLAPPLPWPDPGPSSGPSPVIAPGDTLALTLWSTEDNSLLAAPGQRMTSLPEMQVTPGGGLFLPWIGEVAVAGLDPGAARARIEARYGEVMPAVQVQLARAEGRANTVSLASGVTRAGSYPLREGATLLQILAEGGGVAPGLHNPQIRLHRGGRLYGMALERLATSPGLDIPLQGGDRVLLVADTSVFLSLGAAGRQARHPFPHEELDALDALAIIGGLAPGRADARAILILRRYPAETLRRDATGSSAGSSTGPPAARMVFAIDLTSADGLFSAGQFRIIPGDLVYVSESPLVGTRDLLALAGAVFGLGQRLGGD